MDFYLDVEICKILRKKNSTDIVTQLKEVIEKRKTSATVQISWDKVKNIVGLLEFKNDKEGFMHLVFSLQLLSKTDEKRIFFDSYYEMPIIMDFLFENREKYNINTEYVYCGNYFNIHEYRVPNNLFFSCVFDMTSDRKKDHTENVFLQLVPLQCNQVLITALCIFIRYGTTDCITVIEKILNHNVNLLYCKDSHGNLPISYASCPEMHRLLISTYHSVNTTYKDNTGNIHIDIIGHVKDVSFSINGKTIATFTHEP